MYANGRHCNCIISWFMYKSRVHDAIKKSQFTQNTRSEQMKKFLVITTTVFLILDVVTALVQENKAPIFATMQENRAFFHLFKVQCEFIQRKCKTYILINSMQTCLPQTSFAFLHPRASGHSSLLSNKSKWIQ